METIINSMKPTDSAVIHLCRETYGAELTDIAITIGNYMTDTDMQEILSAIDSGKLYDCLHTLYYFYKEQA